MSSLSCAAVVSPSSDVDSGRFRRKFAGLACRLAGLRPHARRGPEARVRLTVCEAASTSGSYPPRGTGTASHATPATGTYIGKLGSDSAATRATAGVQETLPKKGPLPAEVFWSSALAVGFPVLLGAIVSAFASPLQEWYQNLEKPSWEPPDWVFGPVWSLLYALMGFASWLVWADGGWVKQSGPLRLYIAQLAVNLSWPVIFFKFHQLRLGVLTLGVLVLLVNATMRSFYSVNRTAGWLMLPYLAWTVFALVLNWSIWRKNMGSKDSLSGVSWSAAPGPSNGW